MSSVSGDAKREPQFQQAELAGWGAPLFPKNIGHLHEAYFEAFDTLSHEDAREWLKEIIPLASCVGIEKDVRTTDGYIWGEAHHYVLPGGDNGTDIVILFSVAERSVRPRRQTAVYVRGELTQQSRLELDKLIMLMLDKLEGKEDSAEGF